MFQPGILPPFLMSYGNGNQFIVDWTRVRKWVGADPVAVVGPVTGLNTQWTGAVSSDWNNIANWTAGVPGEWSSMIVPVASNPPILAGSLTISPGTSLSVEAGGALTVTGDLTATGPVTIGSTLTSSGSIIVNGNATGNITYNRQLQPGPDPTRNWHLVSIPVSNNSDANTAKVSAAYEWAELTGTWAATDITLTQPGHGVNIRQTTDSDGLISFHRSAAE